MMGVPAGFQQAPNNRPGWDDFNRRRNQAVKSQGFTTRESAKAPSTGMPQGLPPITGDAATAYLQSIGAVPAQQYSAAPLPQHLVTAPPPSQSLAAPQVPQPSLIPPTALPQPYPVTEWTPVNQNPPLPQPFAVTSVPLPPPQFYPSPPPATAPIAMAPHHQHHSLMLHSLPFTEQPLLMLQQQQQQQQQQQPPFGSAPSYEQPQQQYQYALPQQPQQHLYQQPEQPFPQGQPQMHMHGQAQVGGAPYSGPSQHLAYGGGYEGELM